MQARKTDQGLELSWQGKVDIDHLEDVTFLIYTRAFALGRSSGYPYPARIWNYIPDINSFYEDIENYQRFCGGRKRAYDVLGVETMGYPAASAVGSSSGELVFSFLFSNEPSLPISNPAQQEAYHYPKQYGPTSPSFSRAALCGNVFYLSGTASIRGHSTMYSFSLMDQLQCTLENIDFVLLEAEEKASCKLEKEKMAWRVYLRSTSDQEAVDAVLREKLGGQVDYVKADICRSDLLLEIEGVCIGI